MKYFLAVIILTMSWNGLLAQPVDLKWESVAPGVWKVSIGNPQPIDLLRASGASPRTDALQKMGERAFPSQLSGCYAEKQNGKIYLRFPLGKEEKLYGLGLHFKSVGIRGEVLTLHTDHYGGIDNGRTHAPSPFYISDSGYGVLINSAAYITAYVGTGVRAGSPHLPPAYDRNTDARWESEPLSDAVEMLVPVTGTEVYVFAGNTNMETVQRYNLFCGGGVLPPKWGLGFTERMPTLSTETDVRKEIVDFTKHQFPLDFIGLEPGWQSKAYPCTFEWDSTRFPHPAAFTKDLLDQGIRLNLWLNPYLSPASSQYQTMLPLAGSHTVWNGLVPDMNMPEAVATYRRIFEKNHLDIGISGYKIDEIDGYDNWLWPDVAVFPSGVSGEQMRQVFGLEMQRFTNSWFHDQNKRTYGLARASNAGGSHLPYVLYDDYYDHKDFITAMCSSSFIGVLWTPEVRASKTAEEWLRRMQSVCFSPMAMLNAWSDGTKPWSFPEVTEQVSAVAQLRMRLFPYIYTCFAQYYFEGKPPVRAMNLVEGFTSKEDISDQFMLGDNLLVAPMFTGDKKRKVIFPPGKWYDFYTGRLASGGGIIEIEPGLERIPLYVRDGGIIPMIPPTLHSPRSSEKIPLEIRFYGQQPGRFSLYDDDGETFAYEQGKFSWNIFSATQNKKGKWQPTVNPAFKSDQYSSISWKFMTQE